MNFFYEAKIPIDFWCRYWLNLKFFIKKQETLLVKLTEIHNNYF